MIWSNFLKIFFCCLRLRYPLLFFLFGTNECDFNGWKSADNTESMENYMYNGAEIRWQLH